MTDAAGPDRTGPTTGPAQPEAWRARGSRGGRLFLLLGVLGLLLAGYRLVAPIDIPSPAGPMYRCGSALRPPDDQFSRSVCGRLAEDRQLQTGFLVVAAALVAVGGRYVFGVWWGPGRWPIRPRPSRLDDPDGRPPLTYQPPTRPASGEP